MFHIKKFFLIIISVFLCCIIAGCSNVRTVYDEDKDSAYRQPYKQTRTEQNGNLDFVYDANGNLVKINKLNTNPEQSWNTYNP